MENQDNSLPNERTSSESIESTVSKESSTTEYWIDDDPQDGSHESIIVSTDSESLAKASLITLPHNCSHVTLQKSRRKRRTKIPDKPNYSSSLWATLKNCVGKDLSDISFPLNFSEPLSMLQRLTEDFEYAYLLDHAATLHNRMEKLAYVAVFTVTSYATTDVRTCKPFNPLLGETYECDRTDDLGWKVISEQVSHHPRVAAIYCEGKKWKFWQDFNMANSFRGTYLEVKPLGTAHLLFDSGDHYTWTKVTTIIHNLIVGKLWVSHEGSIEIIEQTKGVKCVMTYNTNSSSEQPRRVRGLVMDEKSTVQWIIDGRWNEKIEIAAVISVEESQKNPVYVTGPFRQVWEKLASAGDSDKYYNMTVLACQLNEPEEGVAPTDSRNRPDQRLMEDGDWDRASKVREILEQKQKEKKKERESMEKEAQESGKKVEPYQPLWFRKEIDPITGCEVYLYNGEYWACKKRKDWSKCPDIYSLTVTESSTPDDFLAPSSSH